jgi:3-oxocholest-4-en-26-oate---CoA ligase
MSNWGYASAFEAVARVYPERSAVTHGSRRVTWQELDLRASRLAASLKAAGLRPGDVVAEYMYNGVEYIETFLAASKAALAPMNTNYRYVEEELVQIWEDAGVKAVVYNSDFGGLVDQVRSRLPHVRAWVEVGDGVAPMTWAMSYEDAIAAHDPLPHGGGDEDSLILIYTGGTTGHPKGVMWRQGDLFSLLNSQNPRPFPERGDEDVLQAHLKEYSREVRCLVASPLMHGAGLFYTISAMGAGGSLITQPGVRFDAAELLETAAREKVHSLAIVGDAFARPLVTALNAQPGRWDLSSLRVVFSSGVMWSDSVKRGLLAHLPGVRLVDGLGSSEASALAATVSVRDDVADTASFVPSDRAGVILDDGTLATSGDGKIGRLAVTGWLPVGYLNDPEKTAQVFVEAAGRRWSVPGDLAQIDASGRIRLLGRGSSCINTGGEKVFAEEVEEALKRHPNVLDAAVVGVPDERLGEKVVALIQGSDESVSLDDVQAHVRAHLAGFKVPKHLAYVYRVDRGVNGKLDRRAVTQVAQEKWGTGHA